MDTWEIFCNNRRGHNQEKGKKSRLKIDKILLPITDSKKSAKEQAPKKEKRRAIYTPHPQEILGQQYC